MVVAQGRPSPAGYWVAMPTRMLKARRPCRIPVRFPSSPGRDRPGLVEFHAFPARSVAVDLREGPPSGPLTSWALHRSRESPLMRSPPDCSLARSKAAFTSHPGRKFVRNPLAGSPGTPRSRTMEHMVAAAVGGFYRIILRGLKPRLPASSMVYVPGDT